MEATITKLNPFNEFIGKVSARRPHIGLSSGAPLFISVVKAAMDLLGLRGGEVRMPLISITQDEKNELADIINNLKIPK
jgi:dihydrodipicolinate synthase/N-acetylneuraminate lyase